MPPWHSQKAPLAGSGIGFCASVSGAVDSAHGSEAQGSAGLAAYKTQARASVMGEKCRLPLVYGCALDQKHQTLISAVNGVHDIDGSTHRSGAVRITQYRHMELQS